MTRPWATPRKRARTSGDDAFALHDTYGFPIDLTLEIAAEAGLSVDEPRFRELMNEQRTRAQKDAKAKKAGHADLSVYNKLAEAGNVHFTGYDTLEGESSIRGIIRDGQLVPFAEQGQEIDLVLNETPFYAESGGQAGDSGLITGDGFVLKSPTQAPVRGLNVHKVIVRDGELPAEALVRTQVDAMRRRSGNRRTPPPTWCTPHCANCLAQRPPRLAPSTRPATCASTSPGLRRSPPRHAAKLKRS